MKTVVAIIVLLIGTGVQADTFGTEANEFELTFQNISSGSNPSSGYGIVGYDYGIGTYEITADQWQKYVNITGGPVGNGPGYNSPPQDEYLSDNQSAVNMASWYEAAQFGNWLNTSKGYQAAYSFDGSGNMSLWGAGDRSATSAFRHKDAVYVLPSENEWVKAAYWNGTELQTYATPDDTLPVAGEDAWYGVPETGIILPVGTLAEELNGTYDMMGNVDEWNESGYKAPDDSVTENRVRHGGSFGDYEVNIRSDDRYHSWSPSYEAHFIGFRIAAIPEPSSIAMIGLVGGLGVFVRRRLMW